MEGGGDIKPREWIGYQERKWKDRLKKMADSWSMPTYGKGGRWEEKIGGPKVREPDRETEKPEASRVMKARENFKVDIMGAWMVSADPEEC